MKAERYERVRELFLAARDRTARDRDRFLDGACRQDAALRAEVERLLAHGELAGSFLEQHALGGDLDLAGLAPALSRGDVDGGGLAPGEAIAGYRVLRVIGAGGFGSVLEAEQERPVERRVAVKVLRPGMDSRQVLARFAAERQTLARMDHAGIARVLDAGSTSLGRPFFAMELVAGEPITDWCARKGSGLRERLELFLQLCAAVQHAHYKGIIHRDLKPSNVLVADGQDGAQVKVIDFGIAKAVGEPLLGGSLATRAGQLIGTPAYMSPEQAVGGGEDVGTRCDVYSLGALLYELLAGEPPFDPGRLSRATPSEFRRVLLEEDPPRPSERAAGSAQTAPRARRLAGDLDWIVLRTLEKDPERRYPSVAELAADLARHLADEPVLARPPGAVYRLRKLARRHRVAFAAGVAIVLALTLGIAGTAWQAVRAGEQRDRALEAREEADRQSKAAEAAREEAVREKAVAEEKAQALLAVLEFVQRMLSAAGPDVAQGSEPTVREMLDATAREIAGGFGGPPEVEAEFRSMLGNVYRQLGLLGEARSHLEWAYRTREALRGPDDPDTLRARNDWAALVAEAGDPAEAERLYALSVAAGRRTLGPEHLRTLTAMNNRAQALRQIGRLDEAAALLEEALECRLRTHGERDRFTLVVLHNLAGIHLQREEWDLAESLLRDALDARLELLGPRHPESLETLSDLGSALLELGRLEESEAVLTEAVEGLSAVYGREHPRSDEASRRLSALRAAKDR